MWPNHPTNGKDFPPLPLIEGEKIDRARTPTRRSSRPGTPSGPCKFIDDNKDRPFFLYVPHNMPHVPLFVSDKFKGKTERGLFGDVIAEIDWSVGQILAALKKHGLDENTLVIFTSDNGPWLSYGNHAGSAGPLREGKGTTWDGGHRVPSLARWPGKIPAGSVCTRAGRRRSTCCRRSPSWPAAEPPQDRIIDGRDIWPLLSGQPGAKTPHEAFYYYWNLRPGSGPQRPVEAALAARIPHARRPAGQGRPARARTSRPRPSWRSTTRGRRRRIQKRRRREPRSRPAAAQDRRSRPGRLGRFAHRPARC